MRKFLLALLAILAFAVIAFILFNGKSDRVDNQTLSILSFGGTFEEAQTKAFFDPFTNATDIEIQKSAYGGEYGQIKSAVETALRSNKAPIYDIVDVESAGLLRGISEGVFERIDYSKIDTSNLFEAAINEFGVATDFYSVSLGWNEQLLGAEKEAPKTWQEFWDVSTFPGKRALKRDARFTLEIALMADGVKPGDVYVNGTLDVDRAFASLDKIKDHVAVWWTTGQQPIQLLEQGDVNYAAAYGARLFASSNNQGSPVKMIWENGILDIEYWAILKGTEKSDVAHKFIDFASQAEQQAILPETLPLGPVNKKAFDFMTDDLKQNLNTSPGTFETQLILNAEFWATNEEQIQDRFNRWLSEG